jgi:hypothetical protein
MMRYFVHRVGPAHALGFGCVVGVILGLLAVLALVLGVLILQAGQAEILRALGPLGSVLAPSLNVSWDAVGLTGLIVVVASGIVYGLGAWLAALGFNVIAHMTGGLTLDITPDATAASLAPVGAAPYTPPALKDPTMPLPRPLQGATPPASFPAGAGSAAAFSTPAPAPPGVIASPDVQPLLVSESDATALWSVRKPVTTIGSDPSNDVVLTGDAGIAPKHAEIRFESSGYVIYDLGSSTGTLVNDRRVQGRNLLKNGFRIKLDSTVLLFRDLP